MPVVVAERFVGGVLVDYFGLDGKPLGQQMQPLQPQMVAVGSVTVVAAVVAVFLLVMEEQASSEYDAEARLVFAVPHAEQSAGKIPLPCLSLLFLLWSYSCHHQKWRSLLQNSSS